MLSDPIFHKDSFVNDCVTNPKRSFVCIMKHWQKRLNCLRVASLAACFLARMGFHLISKNSCGVRRKKVYSCGYDNSLD